MIVRSDQEINDMSVFIQQKAEMMAAKGEEDKKDQIMRILVVLVWLTQRDGEVNMTDFLKNAVMQVTGEFTK